MIKRVCILTSVHPAYDVRIFHKECRSLVSTGFQVILVVPHDYDETVEGIKIKAVPKPKNRKERILKTIWQIYDIALSENADIYHIHDPELLKVGLRLKRQGKKVIYDVHEDLPRQIYNKGWIPKYLRGGVSFITERIENYAAGKVDAIICATPTIARRFKKIHKMVVDIKNYPILNELYNEGTKWIEKEQAVCYVGGISSNRGIFNMIEAIEKTNTHLFLAGQFSHSAERAVAVNMPGWNKVVELGQLNRIEVRKLLQKSMAGLVLFHPEPNHINAQPNKMFEYMSAGIPVIASKFPSWREIIESNKCGICVDPLDSIAIANAIQWIINNPLEAKRMGENGRKAVEEKINWDTDGKKLISLYESLL